jgi:predicted nuclease of restriction endonuclease-like (RecB) superfamily
MPSKPKSSVYTRIRQILESARATAVRSVNTAQVMANWLIGREIVEEEQRGKRRAGYGQQLLQDLSSRLTAELGKGFSVDNLELCRRFFLEYPALLVNEKSDALRRKSSKLPPGTNLEIRHTLRSESWQPGQLHPNLSWTHYRRLLRVDKTEARAFYEVEAIKNNWSARELERQVNSLLYERLALSKDKRGLLRLATKGQEIQHPTDVFKDPVVIEFLGLPEPPGLVESELEQALISNLQSFLLELGKGFAFVARQERITLDGDHFYIDLVFYHAILKCYILIELKVGALTHQDLGQLQFYVNYFDRERRTAGDQPTLGLILCADKNEAVVQYTLGPDQKKQIFTSRYKLHLPTETELKAEIRRELRSLDADVTGETASARKRRKTA